MSLPWVSRAHHEEVIAAYRAAVEETRTPIRETFARFDALMEKYHALKLAGAVAADPKPERLERPTPDVVTQAILKKAGKSSQLRKHYYEFVTEQRNAGVSDEEIAHAILTGVDDDAGVPA